MYYLSDIDTPNLNDRSAINRFLARQENIIIKRMKDSIRHSQLREDVAESEISKIKGIRMEPLRNNILVKVGVSEKLKHESVVCLNRCMKRECGLINNPTKSNLYEDFIENFIYSKETFRTVRVEDHDKDEFYCTPFKLISK